MKHGKGSEKGSSPKSPKYPKAASNPTSAQQLDRGGFAKAKPALASNPLRKK